LVEFSIAEPSERQEPEGYTFMMLGERYLEG
jgi:hypothetical protein